jgi:hypothetical protein
MRPKDQRFFRDSLGVCCAVLHKPSNPLPLLSKDGVTSFVVPRAPRCMTVSAVVFGAGNSQTAFSQYNFDHSLYLIRSILRFAASTIARAFSTRRPVFGRLISLASLCRAEPDVREPSQIAWAWRGYKAASANLDEEKRTDEKLTELAVGSTNTEAVDPGATPERRPSPKRKQGLTDMPRRRSSGKARAPRRSFRLTTGPQVQSESTRRRR